MPVVQFDNGLVVPLSREEWDMELPGPPTLPGREPQSSKATMTQCPLKLCWAMTIHKSQGQTLDRAIVDLEGCFEAGQGYVAVSRLRSLEGMQLRNVKLSFFQASAKQEPVRRFYNQQNDKRPFEGLVDWSGKPLDA